MPVAGCFYPLTVKKNVTFAVNYEVPMFERWGASSHVESVPKATQFVDNPTFEPAKSKCEATAANQTVNIMSPSLPRDVEMREISSSTTNCTPKSTKITTTPSGKGTRRSNRGQKKRDVPLERHRVRYDMELVPPACRNRLFLQSFPAWWLPSQARSLSSANGDSIKPRRSSRLGNATEEQLAPIPTKLEEINPTSSTTESSVEASSPFEDDNSVVWIPSKRSEWEDSISEMTAVCTSASHRRHLASNSQLPFVAPLSREYIRDRVDIDDPLNGYQIRHKTGGWMQGFILWTNFTTWTQYFKFDSLHPRSGITQPAASETVDGDGFLSAELEVQPRSGDPYVGGVVFDSIAEIGLLGAIGCGEHLLRMALDDIRIHHGDKYKYVVLQATEESKTFYEKFGFIRVGAVCRYLNGDSESEVVGYRHWTNANESERSLQMHGGPSYLMALKLPDKEETALFEDRQRAAVDGHDIVKPRSFLEEMMKFAVELKPKIEQLGAAATPAPKAGRRKSLGVNKKRGYDAMMSTAAFNTPPPQHFHKTVPKSAPAMPSFSPNVATPLRPVAQPDADYNPIQGSERLPLNGVVEEHSSNQINPCGTKVSHRDKRNKLSDPNNGQAMDHSTSPINTTASSSAQKKLEASNSGRRPPRDRALSKPDGTENCDLGKSATSEINAPTPHFSDKASTERSKSATNGIAHQSSSRVSNFPGPRALSSSTKNLQIKSELFHEEKLDAHFRSGRALQPLVREFDKANTTLTHKQKGTSASKKSTSVTKKPIKGSLVNDLPSRPDDGALYKQKMKSYPRDRVHFYNKVVRPKISTSPSPQYYFVLHYEEKEGTIRIVPLQVSGILTGTRAGRPRWKAVLDGTDKGNFPTVSTADFVPVEAKMVMKTPLVAVEAWDVM